MSQDLQRQANTAAVLRTLAAGGQASVTELRGSVGLSRPTLDAIISDLLAGGMIRQQDPGSSAGTAISSTGERPLIESARPAAGTPVRRRSGAGRPARNFVINADAGYVAGIDVGRHKILVMIMDLAGVVRVSRRVEVPASIDGAGLLALLQHTLSAATAELGIGLDRLRAIAVGVPGVVDAAGRITRSVVVPQWSGFDLRPLIANWASVPVAVANDANLAVLAEQWRGAAQRCTDVIYILAGRRTRAAIMINSEVLTGRHGEAGEIGSVPELFFDTPEVLLGDPGADSANLAQVFAAARAGDPDSRQRVERFCAELARGIRFLVTVLDPEIVVIGGGLSGAGEQIISGLHDQLDAQVEPDTDRQPMALVSSQLGDTAVALGGIRRAQLIAAAADPLINAVIDGQQKTRSPHGENAGTEGEIVNQPVRSAPSVPPATSPLRVGMIGAGGIAGAHLPAWLALGAQVAHYSWEGAPQLAAGHGGVVADSADELLARVDVVDICTPTPYHREYIELAAAAGKHVFSEKPLARTSADARAAIDACADAGVQLYPGHVVRFFSEYEAMHRQVAAGTIGTIAVQRFTRSGSRPEKDWFHDEEQSGGIILDQMIHDLDFARWNAGEVRTAFARKSRVGEGKDAVINAQVILTHDSGAISYVGGTWARPGTTFRTTFEIAGTAGILRHDSTQYRPVVVDLGQAKADEEGTGLLPAVHGVSPFATEIAEIAAAFTGGPSPRVTAEDGYAAILIAEAAIASLQTGEPVDVATNEQAGALA
ncbi:ROK family protein [Microlunatus elymi]|nr:ROK family protein [Microlunatus elymi]